MTEGIYTSAIVTFTGLLLYLLCEEGKPMEIGRLLFFAGLLSLLKVV